MTMSCRCLTTNYIDWIATDMVVVLCYMHIALCHARCYYKVVHLIWNALPYQFQQHPSVTSFVSALFRSVRRSARQFTCYYWGRARAKIRGRSVNHPAGYKAGQ